MTNNKTGQEITPNTPQCPHGQGPAAAKARKLKLTGKYAVGRNAYAIVDADMFEALNRYRWKAKPNAAKTHVYAVRNTGSKSIRLQRAVLGDPPNASDVAECASKNTLDCRRNNLRWVSKSQNVKAAIEPAVRCARPRKYLCFPHTCKVSFGACEACGKAYRKTKNLQRFCCDTCRWRARSFRHGTR